MKIVKSVVGAPFKAIASVSKNILSGVKKAFKSLTGTTFGRAGLSHHAATGNAQCQQYAASETARLHSAGHGAEVIP